MARRRKGRPVHGWVIVDKPAGPTSTTVVNKVKWAFDAQKAGHAGTLDPAATGLLAIALGEATKTVPFVTDALKAYQFSIRFGEGTNTDDAEGEVIETSDNRPSDDALRVALTRFVGDIEQVPPAFSAVKIDGERAYKRARDGDTPELAARALFVESLELVSRDGPDVATLQMVCGKGGYVRSIARDLGHAVDSCAHVLSLRRLWSGPFTLDEAVSIAWIEEHAKSPDIDSALQPLETGLEDLARVTVNEFAAGRLRNGNPGEVLTSTADFGETALALHKGQPVAIGTYRAGALQPVRVFNL